jgi:putative membrane protein
MMFYGGPIGWYGWGVGWAIQAIIGIFIFLFFFWVILHFLRSFRWHEGYHRYRRWWFDDEDALEILRRRYAKGEISKEEYEKMKEDLKN